MSTVSPLLALADSHWYVHNRCTVQLLALVTQTLRFLPVIETLVENSGILTVEKKLQRALALVIVHDVGAFASPAVMRS
jgi:hypothetical protein